MGERKKIPPRNRKLEVLNCKGLRPWVATSMHRHTAPTGLCLQGWSFPLLLTFRPYGANPCSHTSTTLPSTTLRCRQPYPIPSPLSSIPSTQTSVPSTQTSVPSPRSSVLSTLNAFDYAAFDNAQAAIPLTTSYKIHH
jgi:hypothetical protein